MSRRVSDEEVARFTKYESEENAKRPLIVDFCLDLRDDRATIADLRAKLAAAEQQIAGAKREGMAEAARIVESLASSGAPRGGYPALVEASNRIRAASAPAPSDVAEPDATELPS